MPALRQFLRRLPGEDTTAAFNRFEGYEAYFIKEGKDKLRQHAWFRKFGQNNTSQMKGDGQGMISRRKRSTVLARLGGAFVAG